MSNHARILRAAVVAAAAALLVGCPPPPVSPSQTQPALTRPSAGSGAEEGPVLGTEPLSGGVYESLGSTAPLTGDALVRARLDRAAIFSLVQQKVTPPGTQPASAPATGPASAAASQPAEPPPQAVKYYLQGREQFLQGANSEAMDSLEKALQLDPDAFTVLRLMGRVSFAATQLARGSMYLDRAQRLRPDDVEVNYLLGRYWLERKDLDRAVYYLMRADDSPQRLTSSTQTPLSSFYLARALQAAGFHSAAAQEYERYLEIAALPVPGYRYDRELSYLIDEGWAAHLAAAENDVLAGDYAAAVPHYQAAAIAEPRDAFIISRYVNALVHAGQPEAARTTALAFLDRSGNPISDDAIELLGWSYRASGREQSLISELAERLHGGGGGKDSWAVLTLAAAQAYLGKKADAFKTLYTFLGDHPTNLDVLARLLKRVESVETFQQALERAGGAIRADRTEYEAVLKLFLPLTDTPAAAAYAKRVLPPGSYAAGGFADFYLRAITLRNQNAPQAEVEAAFRMALKAAPDFAPLRDTYINWLLAEEKFSGAAAIVQQAVAAEPNNPKTWQLLVQTEMAQERYFGALKLAQDAKKKFPVNPETRLQLAGLYRLRGQDAECEAELQALISDSPKYEPGYRLLIDSYYARAGRTGFTPTIQSLVATALAKMNTALPDSHYAQINTAILLRILDRLPESEAALRRMQAETPDDPDVLVSLANVREAQGRSADAVATLATAIKAHPTKALVDGLVTLYNRQGKEEEAGALAERMMKENPDVESFYIVYATELNGQEKKAEAITVLKAAAKRFPRSQAVVLELVRRMDQSDDHDGAVITLQTFMRENGETTGRLYLLSHYFSNAGNDDAAAAAMQRLLTIMPDHNGANNDLGYFWADAGVHLEEAEKMIRKAIENMPNDAAFEDSLGWVLYKQGKFAEASAALERAVSLPDGGVPDVIGHLGDALYRAGKAPQAFEYWTRAMQMLMVDRNLSRSDLKTRAYLEKVLADVRAGKQPELSPIAPPAAASTAGGAASTQSAGPATMGASPPQ